MTTGPREFHLAQANIARMRAPLDDPVMADFVAQLQQINQAADRSTGFVWRLQTEDGDATAVRAFEDERILFNMSVWQSVEALRAYVYQGEHRGPLKDRRRWFERVDGPTTVLWWIPRGHIPSVAEARERLTLLADRGPTELAFGFASVFPPPVGSTLDNPRLHQAGTS